MNTKVCFRTAIAALALMIAQQSAFAGATHRVAWSSGTTDYTTAINTAILAAMDDNGTVEFDAGRTYPCKQIRVTDTLRINQNKNYMPAGIEGNGAKLVARDDAHDDFFYLWNMQNHKNNAGGNKDFYIRNLTIDGTYNVRYGLRIWGGKDFLIENVTVRRCGVSGGTLGSGTGAGVQIQGAALTSNFPVSNVTLRNVMSHKNTGHGIVISGNIDKTNVQDVKLENCYAHRNDQAGFRVEGAKDVFLVGCGAEWNAGYGIDVASDGRDVEGLNIFGGYTEHNHQPNFRNWRTAEAMHVPKKIAGVWEDATDWYTNPPSDPLTLNPEYEHSSRAFNVYDVVTGYQNWRDNHYAAYVTAYIANNQTPSTMPAFDELSEQDTSIFLKKNKVTKVKIIGGRFVGTFSYDAASLTDSTISSYGHYPLGLNGSGIPTATAGGVGTFYDYVTPSITSANSLNTHYTSVPDYYTGATTASLKPRNIYLVEHVSNTHDHTDEIREAIEGATMPATDGAMDTIGIVAFEAGKTYKSGPIEITREAGRAMPAGIVGNGATIVPVSGQTGTQSFVSITGLQGSVDPGDDFHFDHHGAFIRDLKLDLWGAGHTYDKALEMTGCKFFFMQDVDVDGKGTYGILLRGYAGAGTYYSALENVSANYCGTGFHIHGFSTDNLAASASSAIYLANVGLYNCSAEENWTGIHCANASVTMRKMHAHDNGSKNPMSPGGRTLWTRFTRSIDLLDCTFEDNDHVNNDIDFDFQNGVSGGKWTAGAFLLGGSTEQSIRYRATATSPAGYHLAQSMLNSDQETFGNVFGAGGPSASTANKKTFGQVVEGSGGI